MDIEQTKPVASFSQVFLDFAHVSYKGVERQSFIFLSVFRWFIQIAFWFLQIAL